MDVTALKVADKVVEDYDVVDSVKGTALNFLKNKRVADILILMKNNAELDINELRITGKTDVLLEAILSKNSVLAENIVNMGFDIKNSEFNYLSSVVSANDYVFLYNLIGAFGRHDVFYLLNKKDAIYGDTPMHTAVKSEVSKEVLFLLIENSSGDSMFIKNNAGDTPMSLLLDNHDYLKAVMGNELISSILRSDFNKNDIKKEKIEVCQKKLQNLKGKWTGDMNFHDFCILFGVY